LLYWPNHANIPSRDFSRIVVDGGAPRTIAPAQVGLNAAKLDAAFEYTRDSTQHGRLLVVRHGWLVYEKYFGRGHRDAMPELASCGKAFTSIAAEKLAKGITIDSPSIVIPTGVKGDIPHNANFVLYRRPDKSN
jgi:CubicO group peptidase (beta-lactamase class C family)